MLYQASILRYASNGSEAMYLDMPRYYYKLVETTYSHL